MTEKVGITDDESLGFLLELRREASAPKDIDAGDGGIKSNASDQAESQLIPDGNIVDRGGAQDTQPRVK